MTRLIKYFLFTVILSSLAGLALAEPQKEKDNPPELLLRSARAWVAQKPAYDGAYRVLDYPGGDPGGSIGVCTDLVVRAYRAIGLDLQVLVHEDMTRNFAAYPAARLYDQLRPDKNIDHRRVPNLMTFLSRKGEVKSLSLEAPGLASWLPGDLVVWDLLDNGIPSHIGIISDKKSDSGLPLVLHHFPPYPTEDNCLSSWKIIGHYRFFPKK